MSHRDSDDNFTFDYPYSKSEFANDYVDIPVEWKEYLCGIGKNVGDKVGDAILVDYMPDVRVPCIVIDDHKYRSINRVLCENSARIGVDLNIFDNHRGVVFVEIVMDTPHFASTNHDGKFDANDLHFVQEHFILNAREHFSFFKAMANSIMIGLLPLHMDDPDEQTAIMIQFPRPDRIANSLDLIKKGLGRRRDETL